MLESDRLVIIPLNHRQLLLYAQCDNTLEAELQLPNSNRKIPTELQDALNETIIPNVANQNENYLFNTLWTAILKDEKKIIGDICIIGEPNELGEIEIGYGIYDDFQGRGLMSEMVASFIDWAKTNRGIKAIVASTNCDNIASIRVLEKNGFIQIAETINEIKWKLFVW
jgi:ribosomal-protein-alanine N-acetyltransferase